MVEGFPGAEAEVTRPGSPRAPGSPSINWPTLFLNPFRIFVTDRSCGKNFLGLMVAECEMVFFYAVKAVSCQHPPKAKSGVSE